MNPQDEVMALREKIARLAKMIGVLRQQYRAVNLKPASSRDDYRLKQMVQRIKATQSDLEDAKAELEKRTGKRR